MHAYAGTRHRIVGAPNTGGVRRREAAAADQRTVPAILDLALFGPTSEPWGAHVAALSSASSNFATSLAILEDEAILVGHASTLRFADFTKALAYWRQHVAGGDGSQTVIRASSSAHSSLDG